MGSPLDDTDEPPFGIDLDGAEVYEEAGARPVGGGGRWHIPRPDQVPAGQPDLAVYQRANGKFSYRSMFGATSLRTNPIFTRVEPEVAD